MEDIKFNAMRRFELERHTAKAWIMKVPSAAAIHSRTFARDLTSFGMRRLEESYVSQIYLTKVEARLIQFELA